MKRLLSMVLAMVAQAPGALAQHCNEDLTLHPGDPVAYKEFGSALALEGNTLLVGARSDRDRGSAAGAAYLYDADTGVQRAKFYASNAQAGDSFGSSVALHAGVAAVGAVRSTTPAFGKVYLFDVATLTELREIQPTVPPENSGFGRQLALNDRYLAVAAPYDDGDRFNGGAVYVFDPATGAQLQRIRSPAGTVWFGWSVALDGDVLAVGSTRQGRREEGAVSLYDLSTGALITTVGPRDGEPGDRFGSSVALEGARLCVGASEADAGVGAAYEFDWTTRTEVARFVSDISPTGAERFGESLAFEGSRLVVGAPFDEFVGNGLPGAAYVFDLQTKQQVAKLFPVDGRSYTDGSLIGFSVALDGGKAVIGAPGTSSNGGLGAGSVYSFDVGLGACWMQHLSSGAAGVDYIPQLLGEGPLRPGGSVQLRLSRAAPNAPTFMVLGLGESLLEFKGGVLYPTWDHAFFGLSTDAAGELSLGGSYPLTAPIIPLYFQTWTLDPAAWKGFSGSYGLRGSVY